MNDAQAIKAIYNAIAEAEKVTTANGFSKAKEQRARQIVTQLRQDLRRLETKTANNTQRKGESKS